MPKRIIKRNLIFESGNLETLKRLVDSNFGYTLIPFLALGGMSKNDKKKKLRLFTPPVPHKRNQFSLQPYPSEAKYSSGAN